MLTFALLVNPIAGVGGPAGLKGSDGINVQELALARGGVPRGLARARRALVAAGATVHQVRWCTWGGAMGEQALAGMNVAAEVLGQPADPTTAEDTRRAARVLANAGTDLLVFCGGDGTARDVLDAVGQRLPVLGVPAGVKMHSAVFTATPESAGEVLARLVGGGLVSAALRDVRDLDEERLRAGEINARFYGELLVPELGGYLQHTKTSGKENETLALEEIVADVLERMAVDGTYVLGTGSSLAAIKNALGMDTSLLGVDVWQVKDGQGHQIGKDVTALWLESRLPAEVVLVLSFTRGQGFLLGRGNQQLTPAVLARAPRTRRWIVGTRSKLSSLQGRPLLVDTDDPTTDADWRGLVQVITGYEDRLWYRVDTHPGLDSTERS